MPGPWLQAERGASLAPAATPFPTYVTCGEDHHTGRARLAANQGFGLFCLCPSLGTSWGWGPCQGTQKGQALGGNKAIVR